MTSLKNIADTFLTAGHVAEKSLMQQVQMFLTYTRLDVTQHAHCFNGYKPWLAGCPLDSQSPIILILSIHMWQAETHHTLLLKQAHGTAYLVLWAIPPPLTI